MTESQLDKFSDAVLNLESASKMAMYLMESAHDVMQSDSLPSADVRCGYCELVGMVSRQLAASVEEVTNVFAECRAGKDY